jgi:hypothetical protein
VLNTLSDDKGDATTTTGWLRFKLGELVGDDGMAGDRKRQEAAEWWGLRRFEALTLTGQTDWCRKEQGRDAEEAGRVEDQIWDG